MGRRWHVIVHMEFDLFPFVPFCSLLVVLDEDKSYVTILIPFLLKKLDFVENLRLSKLPEKLSSFSATERFKKLTTVC